MDNINLNQSGIYAITSPSGKRYVGSAVNLKKRWREHLNSLKRGDHHCAALQRAYHKYDGDFVWSVLVLCPKEELIREEQQQMDWAGPGTLYNSAPRAGNTLGVVHSKQMRDRMRVVKLGTKHSDKTKAHMSESRLGLRKPLTHGPRVAAAKLGKKLSNNTSGYVGVSFHKGTGKWEATRAVFGKNIYLGRYKTAELANQARQNFDRILNYYDHS